MKKFISPLLFILLFTSGFAQPVIPDEVKKNIKARVDQGTNAGIVVGVTDGKTTNYFSYGLKSLNGKPVDERSVFEIGSISKTFTCILLANLVVKGEVSLDDLLQKYLQEGVKAPTRNGAEIKLLHIANHTSGLPRMPGNFSPANPANPFADYSEKQMYDFLNSYQLPRDIGSEYEYSNYAMGLLGHVLAVKKGVSYEQLMVDVIANPLAMKDTRIAFTPDMKNNLAMGHSAGIQVENWDIPTLAGAGAIRSTTIDMIKYVSANMGKTKSALYPAMQLSHKNSRPEGTTPVLGLGWHKNLADGLEIIWHNGGTGGYRTFAGFNADGSMGVVVLSNSNVSIDDIGFHLLNSKSVLKEVDKELVLDEAALEKYVGKYELVPGFVLTVSREGTQLKAQATGQPQLPIFAKTHNVFFYKAVEAQLTFNSGDDGNVKSVTLKQGGQVLEGKRL